MAIERQPYRPGGVRVTIGRPAVIELRADPRTWEVGLARGADGGQARATLRQPAPGAIRLGPAGAAERRIEIDESEALGRAVRRDARAVAEAIFDLAWMGGTAPGSGGAGEEERTSEGRDPDALDEDATV